EGEAEVKPPRPQRLLARAGELEEVVTQHADHAEGNRDEHRDRTCSHRRLTTPTILSPVPRRNERPSRRRTLLSHRLPPKPSPFGFTLNCKRAAIRCSGFDTHSGLLRCPVQR